MSLLRGELGQLFAPEAPHGSTALYLPTSGALSGAWPPTVAKGPPLSSARESVRSEETVLRTTTAHPQTRTPLRYPHHPSQRTVTPQPTPPLLIRRPPRHPRSTASPYEAKTLGPDPLFCLADARISLILPASWQTIALVRTASTDIRPPTSEMPPSRKSSVNAHRGEKSPGPKP